MYLIKKIFIALQQIYFHMGSFFHFIGHAFEKFFTILPTIGRGVNYFIIFSIAAGTFYWIYYMIKDPGKDNNYLSK